MMNSADREQIKAVVREVVRKENGNGTRLSRWAPAIVSLVIVAAGWLVTFGAQQQRLNDHGRRIGTLENSIPTEINRVESRINARLDRFEARITTEIRAMRQRPDWQQP